MPSRRTAGGHRRFVADVLAFPQPAEALEDRDAATRAAVRSAAVVGVTLEARPTLGANTDAGAAFVAARRLLKANLGDTVRATAPVQPPPEASRRIATATGARTTPAATLTGTRIGRRC
jgi:hypothetical protein